VAPDHVNGIITFWHLRVRNGSGDEEAEGEEEAVREGDTARLARLWGTIVFSISGSLMGLGVFSEGPCGPRSRGRSFGVRPDAAT
jgi:hypothetical protein